MEPLKKQEEALIKPSVIAYDYIFMIFCNALVSILSFATTSLLLNYLGREKYGEIVSLTSFSLMLVILGGDWSSQAMVRFGTEEFVNSGRATRFFWNRLYLILICIFLIIFASPVWGYILQRSFDFSFYGIIFILFYLPAQIYWYHIQRILPSIHFHRLRYPLLALERLFVLFATIFLIYSDHLSVNSILPHYIIGCLFAAMVSSYIIQNVISPIPKPDRSVIKKIWLFSWPLIPTSMIGILSSNTIDYLFIRKYDNLAALGVYALAIQISGLAQQIPQIAGDLTTPRFVKWRLENRPDLFETFINRVFQPLNWLWCVTCLSGAIIVSRFGPQYIPEKYQLICQLVWPLSIVTSIVAIWYVIWNPMLIAYEQLRVVMWSSIATGFVNIISNFLLIPRYGVIGCAWATVFAFGTTAAFAETWCRITRDSQLPGRGLRLYLPTTLQFLATLIINSGFVK
ncbi:MAG: lipopolysaccharide biosynthesis protein [bacterium]